MSMQMCPWSQDSLYLLSTGAPPPPLCQPDNGNIVGTPWKTISTVTMTSADMPEWEPAENDFNGNMLQSSCWSVVTRCWINGSYITSPNQIGAISLKNFPICWRVELVPRVMARTQATLRLHSLATIKHSLQKLWWCFRELLHFSHS